MVREGALHLTVFLVADDLGQVLHEVAAAGDVQHLQPAAYREHGHVARKRRFEQRELCAVTFRAKAGGLRMRIGAVVLRVEICTTG